jgi:hypothetical protein
MSTRPFAAPVPVFAMLVSVLLGACTFVYRFNQLGGTLGGFENDHFVQLSMARQIVAGDLPFRDYNEIGAPLTTVSSALGQMIGGHALLPDAVLTLGFIALGTAITCWLAARASGSVMMAVVLTLILAALAPRPYAYPKVLVYAVGILAAWRYVDHPTAARAAVMGVVAALAFLFRHDHGAYLGMFSVLTILAVHGWDTRLAIPRTVLVTTVSLVLLLPFLVFMQVNGGVLEYFRKAIVYAERDAERTSFIAPGIEFGSGEPLLCIEAPAPALPAEINVRWAPTTSDALRRERERQYSLRSGEPQGGRTWSYVVGDPSPGNVAALVRDTLVEDTHGLDRNRFTVSDAHAERGRLFLFLQRLRLAPELTSRTNALAWLYYLFVSLAPAAALVAWFRWRGAAHERADLPYMLPVIVLMAILSVTLLSRGATAIRLPDASAPLAVVSGWLLSAAAVRPKIAAAARRTGTPRAQAGFAGFSVLMIVLITAGAAAVLGDVPSRFDTADLDGGPTAALKRTRKVADELAASPPLRGMTDLDHPGSLRLAEYVRACTGRTDRVFILGNYPEVYFFSGRPFAGSHVWLVPGFYSSARDQQTIIERLRQWRVPIVVTEPASTYDAAYRQYFPAVTAFLDSAYTDAGTVAFGDIELRVLVDARRQASGTYRSARGAELPCFADSGALHVAAQAP